jgi:hypothetical protein
MGVNIAALIAGWHLDAEVCSSNLGKGKKNILSSFRY